jgi:hypothetical protein
MQVQIQAIANVKKGGKTTNQRRGEQRIAGKYIWECENLPERPLFGAHFIYLYEAQPLGCQ